MRFDIWLYTSEEEFRDGAATDGARDLNMIEVGIEIARFESKYRKFMDNNGGRVVVGIVPALVAPIPAPDLLAGVYRAVAPLRDENDRYQDYLKRPLNFQLIDMKFFPGDADVVELEGWLSKVARTYRFDPAEVFVTRDRAQFERTYEGRLKRAYTPGQLARRAGRES